jgi:hypothetical protein
MRRQKTLIEAISIKYFISLSYRTLGKLVFFLSSVFNWVVEEESKFSLRREIKPSRGQHSTIFSKYDELFWLILRSMKRILIDWQRVGSKNRQYSRCASA